jgi:acetyl esterase/lipase
VTQIHPLDPEDAAITAAMRAMLSSSKGAPPGIGLHDLGGVDARDPLASPLYGRHSGMPSTRIHVGDDEVLLDDSLRYVNRTVAAGVDARADVWMGMPHGFPASIGRLKAAEQALDAIGIFLTERLQPTHKTGPRAQG